MANEQHTIEDVSFKIFRVRDNQSLLFSGEIKDNDLSEFVKQPMVKEAVQNFIKQIEYEWSKFKTCKGENMNGNAKGLQAYKENQNTLNDKGAKVAETHPIKQIIKPIRFLLPNAKKGEKYEAIIKTDGDEIKKIENVKFAEKEDIGLFFNEEKQLVSGIPNKSGEFRFNVYYRTEANVTQGGEGMLIINPDPRDLWQNNEPDQNLPYPKSHTDSKIINENNICIVAASRRGRSHAHVGSFRDDDFFVGYNDGWSVLVVADGAGSAKLSRIGSKEASHAVGVLISERLKGTSGNELSILISRWDGEKQNVQQKIYSLFQEAIKNAVDTIETTSTRSYSAQSRDMATTLLAVIARKIGDKVFVASFWVGDGAIAAYSPNSEVKIKVLGVPDEGEYAGQTRFLDRAILQDGDGFNKRIKIGLLSDVKAIFLMTDGVSDPKFETDNGLNDPVRWDALWQEIEPILSDEKPDKKLLEWLDFWSPGNHDDRTIAIQWFDKYHGDN